LAAPLEAGFPIAILQIRRLSLEVPVYAQLNEINLNRGAALIAGTAPPDSNGNTAIAAHRDGYFRELKTWSGEISSRYRRSPECAPIRSRKSRS